jgi:uncharacterized protein YndB with AHSA1/START domain
MVSLKTQSDRGFHKEISILASPSRVWAALTEPGQMKAWMSEYALEIVTDWTVGSPIFIRGIMHKIHFQNTGEVLQFVPKKLLRYSHRSSLSQLPDQLSSYSVVEFRLAPEEDRTILNLTVSNFPTEIIYKHLVFYWNSALEVFKRFTEEQ